MCLREGQGGRRRLYGPAWLSPRSEKEAQSFLPSFLGWLRNHSRCQGCGCVGVGQARMRAAFRGWEGGGVGWEGGRAEGWVCVLEEGRPRTGSPPRPWDLPPTGVALRICSCPDLSLNEGHPPESLPLCRLGERDLQQRQLKVPAPRQWL